MRVTYRKKITLVEPDLEPAHASVLDYIWTCSRLQEDRDADMAPLKWRLIGFESEDITQEFREVGVLGLDCLVSCSERYHTEILLLKIRQRHLVAKDTEYWAKVRA